MAIMKHEKRGKTMKPTWITDNIIRLSREIHDTGEWKKPIDSDTWCVLSNEFIGSQDEKDICWRVAGRASSMVKKIKKFIVPIIPLTDVIDFLSAWGVGYSIFSLAGKKKEAAFAIQPESKQVQAFTSKTITESGLKALLSILKRAKESDKVRDK